MFMFLLMKMFSWAVFLNQWSQGIPEVKIAQLKDYIRKLEVNQ